MLKNKKWFIRKQFYWSVFMILARVVVWWCVSMIQDSISWVSSQKHKSWQSCGFSVRDWSRKPLLKCKRMQLALAKHKKNMFHHPGSKRNGQTHILRTVGFHRTLFTHTHTLHSPSKHYISSVGRAWWWFEADESGLLCYTRWWFVAVIM